MENGSKLASRGSVCIHLHFGSLHRVDIFRGNAVLFPLESRQSEDIRTHALIVTNKQKIGFLEQRREEDNNSNNNNDDDVKNGGGSII